MGCLKGGVVASVVVPTPDYVRFASHYGFRPDWCHAADPQSAVDVVIPRTGGRGVLTGLGAANHYACKIEWLERPSEPSAGAAVSTQLTWP